MGAFLKYYRSILFHKYPTLKHMNTFKQYVHKSMNDYFTVESQTNLSISQVRSVSEKTIATITKYQFSSNKNVFSGFETNNLVKTS